MNRKNNGYTLVETILVLGILGIIGLLIFPKFSFVKSYQENLEIKEIVYHLKSCKSKSLREHKPYTFFCNEKSYGFRNDKGSTIFEENYKSLSFDISSPRKEITFNPKGRPDMESAGKIYLNGTRKYIIIITPVTGSIRWESEN
ncbi:MAG: prepilin-type N-terminal cleavage/methylation domain-containing protein [Tissierellia bacterium]|nr:prepilin-type N-terminal cleavage/methylation domain-containing protein [Tissierellia bacterium]